MKLTDKQVELLKLIKDQLQYGDMADIKTATGKTAAHISRVLNPETELFNEAIVDAAVKIIREREKKVNSQLQSLAASNV